MDKEQLFLEGHKELMTLVHWLANPLLYVEYGTLDQSQLTSIRPGGVIEGYKKAGEAFETVAPLPKETIKIIVETFCESHLRLK